MSEPDEKFPRGSGLPTQSPVFWVEQKDRYLRQLLIRDIEALTKRRLLVYFANRYESAQIDVRDSTLMHELAGDVADEPVDLLLETTGGFTDATESLISVIQNEIKDFRVIVANAAKSNGTLLCLAAKSIVLGPTSELGPIEPLVQGIPCTVLMQPQIAQQNYPLHKFGQYALQQTRKLAETLLSAGMMNGRPQPEIVDVVNKLASRDTYFSHGSVIDHREALQLGLKIEYLSPGDPIWERIWLLYCMYEYDSRRSRYLKIFEGRIRSTAIAAPVPTGPQTANAQP